MARTKASVGARVTSTKSSKARAAAAPPAPSTSSGSKGGSWLSSGGGNPACPRETPAWQLPITRFFNQTEPRKERSASDDDEGAGSSKTSSRRKKNVIESDDESEITVHQPMETSESDAVHNASVCEANDSLLNQSIELAPLDGESCHKIAEYFPKQNKETKDEGTKNNKETKNNGKGGKKTKIPAGNEDKENSDRNSKREIDGEAEVSTSKKVKLSID